MNAYTMPLEELVDAVAKCEGYSDAVSATLLTAGEGNYNPVTRWEQGGPIIAAQRIALRYVRGSWYAMHGDDTGTLEGMSWSQFTSIGGKRYGKLSYEVHSRIRRYKGDTPLEAAMRAYVGSKFPVYEEG